VHRESLKNINVQAYNATQHTFTTFTCQATVRINETACSDVIVRFGLHVWKSFAGWWTKGCMELESMYADVQISRIRQLLSMPLMNLMLSIMDHAAHCKIHPLQTCTDICSMSWSLSHVQSYRQTNFNTGFISTMVDKRLRTTDLSDIVIIQPWVQHTLLDLHYSQICYSLQKSKQK